MALFGRRQQTPRLAPELDDTALRRVLRGVASSRGPAPQDLAIAQVEQLLRDTGDDWDCRCHRVTVLADAAPALACGSPGNADSSSRTRGRGLFLVTQVTERWDTRYTPTGKTIWTEVPLNPTELPGTCQPFGRRPLRRGAGSAPSRRVRRRSSPSSSIWRTT
ncbi:ATP-binding protein [Streptomyces sviceus]|uniref:ATP-binding protein n=1 Tax=Streptomyces sviceus TaxID=285530 RepID=UPI003825A3C7